MSYDKEQIFHWLILIRLVIPSLFLQNTQGTKVLANHKLEV